MAIAERIGRPGNRDTNCTGVHSVSFGDLEKIRQMIREFLLKTDQVVRASDEETICVLSVDFLEL